jgi:hypothetical protein
MVKEKGRKNYDESRLYNSKCPGLLRARYL